VERIPATHNINRTAYLASLFSLMKPLPTVLWIACAICFLCDACKPGQIELRLKPAHNTRYSMVFTTDGKVSMSLGGKELGTDIHSAITSLLQVDSLPGDKYHFQLSYDDYDIKQNVNGKEMDIKNLPGDSSENVGKGIAFIKGLHFSSTMNATGKTEKIDGADSILSRLDSSIAGMPEDNRRQVISVLTPLLNSDVAKGMLEQCFYVFPHGKVNLGDSWHNEIIMQSMFSMVINSTYTLVEIKNGIAQVKVHAIIKPGKPDVLMPGLAMVASKGSDPKPPAGGMDLLGMKMKAAFQGTQDGTVWINMLNGMVQKNQLNQDLVGKISISILDLPMTMKMVTGYEVKQVQ